MFSTNSLSCYRFVPQGSPSSTGPMNAHLGHLLFWGLRTLLGLWWSMSLIMLSLETIGWGIFLIGDHSCWCMWRYKSKGKWQLIWATSWCKWARRLWVWGETMQRMPKSLAMLSLRYATCTIYLPISWLPFVEGSHLGRCCGCVCTLAFDVVCLFFWGRGWEYSKQLDDDPSTVGSAKQFWMSLSLWGSFFFVFYDYAYFPYSPAWFADHPKPCLIFMLFLG